ncbi:MAG: hypothetical protein ACI9DC_002247 [Gammaproteobacteria bacterium]|jgi:hypothetical protein
MNYLNKHLQDVGESYFQHARHAAGFAAVMFVGAVACLGHALLPFAFERTGSDVIRQLHDRMVVNRHNMTPKAHVDTAAGPATAKQ